MMIRRATDADARAAADLWLRARSGPLGVSPRPAHDDDVLCAWFASHVIRAAELWVARDQSDTLCGFLVLKGEWVDQLYVEPTMTGRGIGGGLVNIAKRERPEGLRLWTFAKSAGARRFYERHGFVHTRRANDLVNDKAAASILYVWDGDRPGMSAA